MNYDSSDIARTLINNFVDYRDAWHYALRIARTATDAQLSKAYSQAATIISDHCYAKTARPIYS